MICVCAYTGKWGKDDAVLQVDAAYADGGEECRGRGRHGTLLGPGYGVMMVLIGETAIHGVCFIARLQC